VEVAGVVVYSEPRTYSQVDFTMYRPWKVAVGVHPKHYDTLTVGKAITLQRLLDHPAVVALAMVSVAWIRQLAPYNSADRKKFSLNFLY
jgi:hypothetical protein